MASHRLWRAECNYSDYSSFKLELLALKWAVHEKFKAYTLGSHCVIVANRGPESVTLPTQIRLLTIREVTEIEHVIISPTAGALNVSVQEPVP